MSEVSIHGSDAHIVIVSRTHGVHTAIVDAHDIDLVEGYSWCVRKDRTRRDGASFLPVARVGGRVTRMHHLIIGRPPDGLVVDHIDGQPLNNRRSNLRLATPAMNSRNGVSARGVYWHKVRGKWYSKIQVGVGNTVFLGYFDDEHEARRVYCEAKRSMHGVVI